jgi:hypothetical protein
MNIKKNGGKNANNINQNIGNLGYTLVRIYGYDVATIIE